MLLAWTHKTKHGRIALQAQAFTSSPPTPTGATPASTGACWRVPAAWPRSTLMQGVGLSMAPGPFLAGMPLAESEYRRELELFEKMYPHYQDQAKIIAVVTQGRQQLEEQTAQQREQRAQRRPKGWDT